MRHRERGPYAHLVTIIEAPVTRSVADLPKCCALAIDRDRPPEQRKWRMRFEMGAVYAIEEPTGRLAACAVLTKFGDGLAAADETAT
jgi:hypothetical protein